MTHKSDNEQTFESQYFTHRETLVSTLRSLVFDDWNQCLEHPLVFFTATSHQDIVLTKAKGRSPTESAADYERMTRAWGPDVGVMAAGFIWVDVPAEHRLMPGHSIIVHVEWDDSVQTFAAIRGEAWMDVTPKLRSPFPPLFPHRSIGQA